MKPTTQSIITLLNNNKDVQHLKMFKQINPTYSFAEITVQGAFELYELNKNLIIKAIET